MPEVSSLQDNISARLSILGDVAAPDFPDWIAERALRLSLVGRIESSGPDCLVVAVEGPEALIDAMELACSLGPASVMVDRIERQRLNGALQRSGFQIA